MPKYQITVDGGHQAEISLELDGRGGFTGTVVSPDYGTGQITDGKQSGATLGGNVSLDGYTADFSAALTGSEITGKLSYGWFFNKSFSGALSA